VIRAISFASCYVYSPSGRCITSVRSRQLCAVLKAGDEAFLRRYALRVRREADAPSVLAEVFHGDSVLVPVPGSGPDAGAAPWVAAALARALLRQGLGRAVWTGLRRVRPVPKSASAPGGRRPTVATHFRSFSVNAGRTVDAGGAPPADFVLIDDVVTKGRTLFAAAAALQEAFPLARIRAFALLRTMGMVPDVERLIEPCRGEIRWQSGDTHRTP
jgi:hypothetical protein